MTAVYVPVCEVPITTDSSGQLFCESGFQTQYLQPAFPVLSKDDFEVLAPSLIGIILIAVGFKYLFKSVPIPS